MEGVKPTIRREWRYKGRFAYSCHGLNVWGFGEDANSAYRAWLDVIKPGTTD
jgi:hypothetical protein